MRVRGLGVWDELAGDMWHALLGVFGLKAFMDLLFSGYSRREQACNMYTTPAQIYELNSR